MTNTEERNPLVGRGRRLIGTGRLTCAFALVFILLGIGALSRASAEDSAETSEEAAPFGLRIQVEDGGSPKQVTAGLKIVFLITALSLAPSAMIMMTSFTRILIILSFLRHAIGTQQEPPGQILAAMALFLTVFIMFPIGSKIHADAIKPYMEQQIDEKQAWEAGVAPLKRFMLDQTGPRELQLFMELSKKPMPKAESEVTLDVLVPAFMLSELKTAFQMGFLVFLPFLVIDLVIASSLMSLGMMMLPPMLISMPIKVLFFVLADGWTLVMRGIITSYSL